MKWGILATGNIAKKFASTINQMSKENEQLVAVGSRNIESAKAFANEHTYSNRPVVQKFNFHVCSEFSGSYFFA